jgi:hypothetical protein
MLLPGEGVVMPFSLPAEGIVFLWVGAALVAAWVVLPMLLGMAGQRRLIFVPEEDATATLTQPPDREEEEITAELASLGFRPLGLIHETICCHGPDWAKYFRVRVFATPEHDCFASIFRLVPGEAIRLAYSTVFSDGGMVQSAHQLAETRIERETYFRWGDATVSLPELLRLHREVCERFRSGRADRAVARPSLAEFAEVDRRHSDDTLGQDFAGLPLQCLMDAGPHLLMPPAFFALTCGIWHWMVPLAMALGGLRYGVLRRMAFRQAAKQMRAEDLAGRAG